MSHYDTPLRFLPELGVRAVLTDLLAAKDVRLTSEQKLTFTQTVLTTQLPQIISEIAPLAKKKSVAEVFIQDFMSLQTSDRVNQQRCLDLMRTF